jgi:predicted dehydrogenase
MDERLMVDSPYSVGVIGAGNVTTTFHLPILANLSVVDLAYVADIDGARAETFASIYDAESVIIDGGPPDPPQTDAALLATPVGVREAYVEHFGETGVALFAEKPFAPNMSTHRQFLDQLSAPTVCNYMRTTYGTIGQLAALVDGTAFGQLEGVTMTRGLIGSTGISSGSFRTDSQKSGGGVLMEKGCHDLSQLCAVFRDSPIEVTASEIAWRGSLDVAVEATLRIGEPHDIDVDYRISMVEPYETAATFRFAEADVRCRHPDADGTLTIDVHDAGRGATADLEFRRPDDGARSTEEAMYLRWREFLNTLDDSNHDPERTTELDVTRLVTELYDRAEGPKGAA